MSAKKKQADSVPWKQWREAAKAGDENAQWQYFSYQWDPWSPEPLGDGRAQIRISAWGAAKGLVDADIEADEVIDNTEDLKRVAERHCNKWLESEEQFWRSLFHCWLMDECAIDLTEVRRVFRTHFVKYYCEAAAKSKAAKERASVQITDISEKGDIRLYAIELVDKRYPDEPVRFEVEVGGQGGTMLREPSSNA